MFEFGRERARVRPVLRLIIELILNATDHGALQDAERIRTLQALQTIREDVHARAVQQARMDAIRQGDQNPWFPASASRVRGDAPDAIVKAALKVQPALRRGLVSSRVESLALAPGRELARRVIEEAPDHQLREPTEREKKFVDNHESARRIYGQRKRPKSSKSLLDELREIDDDFPRQAEDQDGTPEGDQPKSRYAPRNGRKKPVGWARVLRGETNCALCVMLAARGPVYRASTVGTQTKHGILDSAAKLYHPHCDCDSVLVYDIMDWPGLEAHMAAREIYDEATKSVRDSATSPAWRDNPYLASLGQFLRDKPGAVKEIFDSYA